MSAPAGAAGPARACSSCSGALSSLGAQPMRTGGVSGHPDSVLWLAAYWCPRCGKVEFYTVG